MVTLPACKFFEMVNPMVLKAIQHKPIITSVTICK